MSNAFTNFLRDVGTGIFEGDGANMRDYAHASKLYVNNNYARMPKVGFLYYVVFNPSENSSLKRVLGKRNKNDIGLLVRNIDLPKFKITTETVNQYNRKTVVQTKINYNPISITFHDDSSDITTDLWRSYYSHYFADSKYGNEGIDLNDRAGILNALKNNIVEYGDTKYADKMYAYGLNNNQTKPFLKSIEIYVLHRGRGKSDFTQYTLVNPLITDWSHDSLSQDENAKTLTNKMNLSYEFVYYRTGNIINNIQPRGFASVHYDRTPSPLGVGGSGQLFGNGGLISGFSDVFGSGGSLTNARSPLDLLVAASQIRSLSKNARQLKSSNVANEGYKIGASLVAGALSNPNEEGNIPQGRTGIAPVTNTSVSGDTVARNRPVTGK